MSYFAAKRKRVFTSADVLFSFENVSEGQKEKVFSFADDLFSSENISAEQNRKIRSFFKGTRQWLNNLEVFNSPPQNLGVWKPGG